VLLDDWQNLLVNELASGLADEFLLVVQQRIKVEEIYSGEPGHWLCLLLWL
jgi:hypothetical protein